MLFLIDCNIFRYVLLYNSECDSENPRPISEIIRLTEKEEKQIPIQNQQQVYYINFWIFGLTIVCLSGVTSNNGQWVTRTSNGQMLSNVLCEWRIDGRDLEEESYWNSDFSTHKISDLASPGYLLSVKVVNFICHTPN